MGRLCVDPAESAATRYYPTHCAGTINQITPSPNNTLRAARISMQQYNKSPIIKFVFSPHVYRKATQGDRYNKWYSITSDNREPRRGGWSGEEKEEVV